MDDKIRYGIMTILFNSIGVPCFMQGKINLGIIRIVLGVVSFGVIFIINCIHGIIRGIKILQMTNSEYAAIDKTSFIAGFPALH